MVTSGSECYQKVVRSIEYQKHSKAIFDDIETLKLFGTHKSSSESKCWPTNGKSQLIVPLSSVSLKPCW